METPLKDNVYILADHEAASLSAVSLFVQTAKKAIEETGTFFVAISGGSTPIRMLSSLGSEHALSLAWDKVHIFWVDERCVPADSADSNFGSADELLLSRVPLPEGNIHRIRGEEDPSKEAVRYEKEIRKTFQTEGLPVYDLVFLGIGIDGHTASLFPNTDSLSEDKRLVIPVDGGPYRGWRITLTLGVINNAKNVLFLVTGSEKAGIVSKILADDEERSEYPAGLVHPVKGSLLWILDEGSAKKMNVAKA